MPNFTAIFNLPYPTASDAPCDFDEQWCDFTEAIDGVFSTFDAGAARTNPIIPMAIMKQTQPASVANLTAIPFDTVLVDTAGMTDIDLDPFSITILRPGRYTVNAFLEKPSSGTALNSQMTFLVINTLASAETLERGIIQYRLTAYNAVESLNSGDKIQLSFNTGASGFFPVTQAWLSVVWHSDTEVN